MNGAAGYFLVVIKYVVFRRVLFTQKHREFIYNRIHNVKLDPSSDM